MPKRGEKSVIKCLVYKNNIKEWNQVLGEWWRSYNIKITGDTKHFVEKWGKFLQNKDEIKKFIITFKFNRKFAMNFVFKENLR